MHFEENELEKGHLYIQLGCLSFTKGDFTKALKRFFEGRDNYIFNNYDNSYQLADAYTNIGNVYQMKGELTKSLEFYDKSIEI